MLLVKWFVRAGFFTPSTLRRRLDMCEISSNMPVTTSHLSRNFKKWSISAASEKLRKIEYILQFRSFLLNLRTNFAWAANPTYREGIKECQTNVLAICKQPQQYGRSLWRSPATPAMTLEAKNQIVRQTPIITPRVESGISERDHQIFEKHDSHLPRGCFSNQVLLIWLFVHPAHPNSLATSDFPTEWYHNKTAINQACSKVQTLRLP